MKIKGRIVVFTLLVIFVTTISKLMFSPKIVWSGFSPVIAVALFSGMIVKEKSKSFLLPLLALFISDVLIQLFYKMGLFPFEGLYAYQWLNYAILLTVTLIGWLLQGKNYTSLLAGALAGPVLFYLISNFSVWAGHGGYLRPMTLNGLMLCMVDGLPFFGHSLAATLLFLPGLLVSYNAIVKRQYSITLAA